MTIHNWFFRSRLKTCPGKIFRFFLGLFLPISSPFVRGYINLRIWPLKKGSKGHCLFLCALLQCLCVNAEVYYEGTNTFRNNGKVDISWLEQLLPYNPVFIDIGAYLGEDTCRTSKIWPKSRIYAFEPNPRAFGILEATLKQLELTNIKAYNWAVSNYNGTATLYLSHGLSGNDLSYEHQSSLLPPSAAMEVEYQGPHIDVPCVILDDWCQQNKITRVDVLRIESEGLELQILQSSPKILQTAKIVMLQSFFSPLRQEMSNYFYLKDYLVKSGFVPLAHWYTPNMRGLAVYVSKELFDAYFVHSLGLGSGGIHYP